MNIRKVTIENYRAIRYVQVNLNYSINPIIGVNESGKTSILKAIMCLDKGRDKTNKGEHLDFNNKYFNKDEENCKITAEIVIPKDEINDLAEECGLVVNGETHKLLKQINKRNPLIFIRNLSDNLSYTAFVNEKELAGKIVSKIVKRFPVILYFDDFTDRVPVEVKFSETYQSDRKLSRKNREWQEIVIEIFKRADLDGIGKSENPLIAFMNEENTDRRDGMLSDVQDLLEEQIIEEWRKIKKSGRNKFADDSENLKIEISYDGDHTFTFKVRDRSNKNKKRTFNIHDRSKGFQWFFNYMIKLKFNPRYTKKRSNSLFLLDEPGSYLHSSAQSELLKELKRVSKDNYIIYCTHSQFLLNPADIKIGSIKIAEKKESIVTLINFGDYKGARDKGALSPVYQALGLNYTNEFVGNIIVTEGIVDFYLFDMIKSQWQGTFQNVKIIAGSGSGNGTALISFAISFSEDFRVAFDNDRGAEAMKKYIREFGQEIMEKFVVYHPDHKKFDLEKHFCKKDQIRLLEITDGKSIKGAIPILYNDKKNDQKDFFDSLSEKSKSQLMITIRSLDFDN